MRSPIPITIGLFIFIGALVFTGCLQTDRWNRIPLSGQVAVREISNSMAIEGTLTLIPLAETAGPAATIEITKGRYQFDVTNGPVAGKHIAVLSIRQNTPLPPRDISVPLTPKTDPNIAENAKLHYLPEKRIEIVVPAKHPYILDVRES